MLFHEIFESHNTSLVENFPSGATPDQIATVRMDPQVRQLQNQVTQLQNVLKKYEHQAGTPAYRDAKARLTDMQRQLENRHRRVFAQKFGMTDVQAADHRASREAHAKANDPLLPRKTLDMPVDHSERTSSGLMFWPDEARLGYPELRRELDAEIAAGRIPLNISAIADRLGDAGVKAHTVEKRIKTEDRLAKYRPYL